MAHELVQTLLVLNDAPPPASARHQTDGKAGATAQSNLAGALDISQLTRAIVAGDEAAFTQFYDLYSARLRRFLLVLTSGQEDLARELHQLVMIKVARKFRAFHTEEALWAWLAQVARHAFIDSLRQQNRRLEKPLPGLPHDPVPWPDDQAEKHLVDWLDHALQHLEEEELALVEAVYFEDRAHGEIATETGQTAKAVESRLARIRVKLRRFILTRLRHERKAN